MSLERSHENVIEFLDDEKEAMLTLSKQRYITRVKKLAESHPDEVYIYQNPDGTIFAKVPVRWVKISPPREMTDEQREMASKRMSELRERQLTESYKS